MVTRIRAFDYLSCPMGFRALSMTIIYKNRNNLIIILCNLLIIIKSSILQ